MVQYNAKKVILKDANGNYLIPYTAQNSYAPPLLSTIWSDHIISDVSWLRADSFTWQDGNVYSIVYNKLVEEYAWGDAETEGSITFKRTLNGFKIADVTQEQAISDKYNTHGIAWYYILDKENKRFKLPRTKFGFEGLRNNVGGDIAESLPNHTHTVTAFYWDANGVAEEGRGAPDYGHNLAITTSKASVNNSIYKDNAPVQEKATQMYLYFFVGNFSKQAIEQTAGLNSEMFNQKADVELMNSELANINQKMNSLKDELALVPDYTKGISVSSGYTVTQPSMALWFRYGGGLWWGVYFWINGIEFGCGGNTYGDRASGSSVTAYVDKGDELTFSSGYVKVFPLKAVKV